MLCSQSACSSVSPAAMQMSRRAVLPAPWPCQRQQWQQRRRRHSTAVCAEAAEQEAAAPADIAEAGPQRCKLCGVDLASAPRGCDNEGHVIKGLGSWPGFGWFEALRVYGHCPQAAKKGIAYTRKGDTLDEIMFGKDK